DHLGELLKHGGKGLIDCAVVNSSHFSASVKRRYAAQSAAPVEYDSAAIQAMGIEVVEAPLLAEYRADKERRLKARHDAEALANVAMMLAERGRARRRGGNGVKAGRVPASGIRQTGR
ncbi:MAG TPA: 2-phospho-L-lactate transferase CofD family protein, partial [Bryobacteraceae bacterium]|nr:2-phospho-L-lactate transferase CofD family protein [Bryobacteraceae bacterium]